MMKNQLKNNIRKSLLGSSVLAFAFTGDLLAADDHGHDHGDHKGHDHAGHDKAKAGPNGGKILYSVEPHLEFFVTKDRKVMITALGEDGKAAPIGEQTVTIIAGDRRNPTRMSFAKDGKVLMSDKAFPEGNKFPVVVQIKVTPDSKSTIEKFNLDLSDCPTCDYLEYACTCDHGHDHGHGHGHDHGHDH